MNKFSKQFLRDLQTMAKLQISTVTTCMVSVNKLQKLARAMQQHYIVEHIANCVRA